MYLDTGFVEPGPDGIDELLGGIEGGAAPGLLNCASNAARLAVGVADWVGGGA